MGGTIVINAAQFATLVKSAEEFGSFVRMTLNPLLNKGVKVEYRTPFGTLAFNIDQHGKRTSAAV